jgi:pimeloyl-ACP methyl ester carboxylesterase
MVGLPLLLLSGTLCNATLFEHQLTHLAEITCPRVVAVHLQGDLRAVAHYVLSQVEGPFAVAGLSYGGIVALEMWRQAAGHIVRIALLNTNPRAPSAEMRERQQRFVGMAHLGEFRSITTDFLKDAMLHPDHRRDLKLREAVLDMAESIGIQGFVNTVKAHLGRPDSMPDLPHITCPTLVLTGREDRVVPVPVHLEMAQALPNSRLVIVEYCGHLSTMEQPEIVTDALREWLTDSGAWKP